MSELKARNRLDRLEKFAEEVLAGIAQLRESQAKTDEQMRRTDAKLDRIGKQLGDLGLVQGEVAEDLFFRNLRGVFRFAFGEKAKASMVSSILPKETYFFTSVPLSTNNRKTNQRPLQRQEKT